MAFNKKIREQIWNMYSGHCSYCGSEIKMKGFHIDHKIPQWMSLSYYNEFKKDINDIDNLTPSCKRCNHYKRGDTVDQFRLKMLTLHKRIAKIYINKVAVDFRMIDIKPFDGKFYFEKI